MPPTANSPRRPLAHLLYPLLAPILVWLLLPTPAAAEAIDRGVEQALVANDWERVFTLLDGHVYARRDPIEAFLLNQACLVTGRKCHLDTYDEIWATPRLEKRVFKWVEGFHKRNPESFTANFLAAEMQSRERREEALDSYSRVIERDTAFAPAWIGRGIAYVYLNRWSEAISDFTHALALRPRDASTYGWRGIAYTLAGHPDSALSDYSLALDLDPDRVEAAMNRGVAYQKLGMLSEAIADYTLAIRLQPDLDAAYGSRGDLYGRQGNLSAALADFEKNLEMNSDEPLAVTVPARRRIEVLRELIAGTSDIGASADLAAGMYLTAIGCFTEAAEPLTRVIEGDSLQTEAWRCRAGAYAASSDLPGAISDYSRLLSLSPQDTSGYYQRGFCHFLCREYDAAIADYSHVIALDSSIARAYVERAMAYEHLRDNPKAIADYKRFETLADDNRDDHKQLLLASHGASKSLSSDHPCPPDSGAIAAVKSAYAAMKSHDWPALAELMRESDLRKFRIRAHAQTKDLRTADGKRIRVDGVKTPSQYRTNEEAFAGHMRFLTSALPAYSNYVDAELVDVVGLLCRPDNRYVVVLRIRWGSGREVVAIESVERDGDRWRLQMPRMIALVMEALKTVPYDFGPAPSAFWQWLFHLW